MVSSQLFQDRSPLPLPPPPLPVSTSILVLKKHPLFYCETLKLVNPKLAELGFLGKPHGHVQMSGTGLHLFTSIYHHLTWWWTLTVYLCMACLPRRMWGARGQGFVFSPWNSQHLGWLLAHSGCPISICGMSEWILIFSGCELLWPWSWPVFLKRVVLGPWGFLRPLQGVCMVKTIVITILDCYLSFHFYSPMSTNPSEPVLSK